MIKPCLGKVVVKCNCKGSNFATTIAMAGIMKPAAANRDLLDVLTELFAGLGVSFEPREQSPPSQLRNVSRRKKHTSTCSDLALTGDRDSSLLLIPGIKLFDIYAFVCFCLLSVHFSCSLWSQEKIVLFHGLTLRLLRGLDNVQDTLVKPVVQRCLLFCLPKN